jgi:hypothetical protein
MNASCVGQLSASVYIACCSMIIALCALFVSISQMLIQRRHNQLSVRPFLDYNRAVNNGACWKVELFNAGAGPAFITDFKVLLGNELISSPSSQLFSSAIIATGIPPPHTVCAYQPALPKSIKAGESKVLLEFNLAVVNLAGKPSNKFGWQIGYESIYGEKYTLNIPRYTD